MLCFSQGCEFKCPHTCTVRPLYGCDYRAPRCTECSACHDFGNGIAKVLRLPRFRNGIAKVLRLPRFRTPPAARATTSCPSRQLPNATPATQTHTQMHKMLRLPRLRQRHRQSAAPATISQRHRQSAAPATISHAPRARATTSCPSRQLPNASPATQTHTQMHRMLRLPRLRQRHRQSAAPATISQRHAKVLRLPRFRTPPAARATTSCPSRQLPNATPATQTHTQMHRMLRLPRLRQRHRQSAAPATISQRHRQSAAPAKISHAPRLLSL